MDSTKSIDLKYDVIDNDINKKSIRRLLLSSSHLELK